MQAMQKERCSLGRKRYEAFLRMIPAVCIFTLTLLMMAAFPAQAQVVFSDDFDDGAGCDTLAPNWTTTDTNLADIGTFTSNSGSCSLFTRGDVVSVTSVAIDLSSAAGGTLTAWLRAGDDAFSEDPDAAGEGFVAEYLDEFGFWNTLISFDATATTPGSITNLNVTLPAAALHAGFQLRFSQEGGTGGPPANGGLGWDFWHVDDVVVTQTTTPPPPPSLNANSCDEFEEGALNNWSVSNATRVGINGDTFNSASNSMFLRHDTATATSVSVNATGLTQVSVWVRRGSDTFSENPDAGENLVLEYLDSSNIWTTLETFTGTGTQGQIFNRTYAADATFRHTNFRLRFRYLTGSGSDFDYWHVDDVCLISGNPNLTVTKSVIIESDPLGSNFAIPEALARYTIDVENTGLGVIDANTIIITDTLDPNVALFVGDLDGAGSPFIFTDGIGADESGVNINFASLGSTTDGVIFRDSSNNIINPTGPYDPTVASFEIIFTGAMNGTGSGGTPNFNIQYRTQIE